MYGPLGITYCCIGWKIWNYTEYFLSGAVAAQDMRLECSAIKESVRQFNERTTDDADFSAFSFH